MHIKIHGLIAQRTDKRYIKRRGRKLKPVRPNRRNELWYKAKLLAIVNQLTKQTEARLFPLIKRIFDDPQITDAKSPRLSAIQEEIKIAMRRFGGIQSVADRLAKLAAEQNLKGVDDALIANVRRAIGINIAGMFTRDGAIQTKLKEAITANVDLITSIPTTYFEKVEKAVTDNYTSGMRYETIIGEIQRVGEVTESRAKLIARDQTSKMNSSFNSVRQKDLGIEKYTWQTAGDERVRPEHAEHDGKTYRWDDPPEDTGHPGEDIQCRCVAIPVFDLDAMEAELGL